MSLLQNSLKTGRDGARPSRRQRKRPVLDNGGTASVPSAGVLQEAHMITIKQDVSFLFHLAAFTPAATLNHEHFVRPEAGVDQAGGGVGICVRFCGGFLPGWEGAGDNICPLEADGTTRRTTWTRTRWVFAVARA